MGGETERIVDVENQGIGLNQFLGFFDFEERIKFF